MVFLRSRGKYRDKVKLSVFLSKHHLMNTYWGNGGIAISFLNLGKMELSDQLHALAAFSLW